MPTMVARDEMLRARSAWFASQPKTATLMNYCQLRIAAWTAGYEGGADFETWLRGHDAPGWHKDMGINMARFAYEAGREARGE